MLDRIFKRRKKQLAKRSFDAVFDTAINPLVGKTNVNDDIEYSIDQLRDQAWNLADNNPYVSRLLGVAKSNLIGQKGVRAKVFGNDELTKRVEKSFAEWCDNFCTVDKKSWNDFCTFAINSYIVDGEFFVRYYYNFNNPYKFSIKLLESELCDHMKSEKLNEESFIRLGVEMDAYEAPVAYYFLKDSPRGKFSNMARREHIRLSFEEILHVYNQKRSSAVRGVSLLTPVLKTLRNLDKYAEAELIAARVAASKMGFVVEGKSNDKFVADKLDENNDPKFVGDIGKISVLPDGTQFIPWEHGNNAINFEQFSKSILRQFSAGVNGDYTSLSNDLKSASFANARQGAMIDREMWESTFSFFTEKLFKPVYLEWLKVQRLQNKFNVSDNEYEKLKNVSFVGKKFRYYDFYKDMKAMDLERKMGLKTWTQQLAEQGIDIDEHLDTLEIEDQKLKEKGFNSLRLESLSGLSSEEISDMAHEIERGSDD